VVKTLDGVAEGEVRSETRKKGLFHQRDDGFTVLLPLETVLGLCRSQELTGETGCREKHPRNGKTAA